jgi:hypothetical protein
MKVGIGQLCEGQLEMCRCDRADIEAYSNELIQHLRQQALNKDRGAVYETERDSCSDANSRQGS